MVKVPQAMCSFGPQRGLYAGGSGSGLCQAFDRQVKRPVLSIASHGLWLELRAGGLKNYHVDSIGC